MKKDEGTEQEPQAEAPKEEVQPQAEPKKEAEPKEKMVAVRLWRAKQACMLPWRDFERGETVELKDSQVTPLIRQLFECLDGGAPVAEKPDPDLAVMVARLKAAKIPVKKGTSAEEIRKLFDKFLGSGATAGEISDEAAK